MQDLIKPLKSSISPEFRLDSLPHDNKAISSSPPPLFFPKSQPCTASSTAIKNPISPSSIFRNMKKLYRKGSVHPSPSLKPDHLSFLPVTILTLTVALSPEDREVLAYLISCSSSSSFSGNQRRNATTNSITSSGGGIVDLPPSLTCHCFSCYMSYWVRWDSSPNRQLIHEIIDAYEDGLSSIQNKKEKSREERRKGKGSIVGGSSELKRSKLIPPGNMEFTESSSEETATSIDDGGEKKGETEEEEEEMGKGGSVRRFVSYLGEKIWTVWT